MDEFPVRVPLRLGKLLILRGEVTGLDRLLLGTAEHAHYAAAGRLDQAPFLVAGDRVAVELAQLAHRHRIALVLQQVLQRLRVALLLLVVRGDGVAVLLAAEQQLGLLFALRGVRRELAVGGEPRAEQRDEQQEGHVGEAGLPLYGTTSAHIPSPRCARRRRRPSSDRPAAPAPRWRSA